ncbi:anoctamin-6-like [Lynx rufus]|uniref:anoctamin-6-like n=1 Tax=Lynx rufus TaxID=61384 RepID=UPI001F1278B7|nr:anoctamin-6-like [Lynx rufus]
MEKLLAPDGDGTVDEDPNDDRLCASCVNICASDSGGNLSRGRKTEIVGLLLCLGTVFFSIFMSLWATAFLGHRKCKSITLVHHWDRSDFQEEESKPPSTIVSPEPLW